MLAVARQGRLEEAQQYREENKEHVCKAEAKLGVLEEVLQTDRLEKVIYDEGRRRMKDGDASRQEPWWEENEMVLKRTELRYGSLSLPTTDPQASDEERPQASAEV
jgi:hypothetical protein